MLNNLLQFLKEMPNVYITLKLNVGSKYNYYTIPAFFILTKNAEIV